MSLGPMWASPPKVRADVVISSSPPHNLRPICRNKLRARVTPRPPHTGESRRGCQSLQSLQTAAQHQGGAGLGGGERRVEGKGSPQDRAWAYSSFTCPSQGSSVQSWLLFGETEGWTNILEKVQRTRRLKSSHSKIIQA